MCTPTASPLGAAAGRSHLPLAYSPQTQNMAIGQHGFVYANGESLGCGRRTQSLAVGVLTADPQYGHWATGEAMMFSQK
jgi:hypothetical protein